MIDLSAYASLKAHIIDLKDKSELWHKTLCSSFLNEDEVAAMMKEFPPSSTIHYEGGYPDARKKKIVLLNGEEDDFFDIVCIRARIDQRFRKIGHRDILGALMHLQIDRHAFGDFWIADNYIYIYTSVSMAQFLCDNLIKINQLSVHFEVIQDRPKQVFQTKIVRMVVASERLDALVSGITHLSRAKSKELIRAGLVSLNHLPLEAPDKLCDNNVTISVRGYGRYKYLGIVRNTKSDRIVAEFEISI